MRPFGVPNDVEHALENAPHPEECRSWLQSVGGDALNSALDEIEYRKLGSNLHENEAAAPPPQPKDGT